MSIAVSADDLRQLEQQVALALTERNTARLNIVGFGEVSVAIGWPTDSPVAVCKRMPPMTDSEFSAYASLVADYTEALQAIGLLVVDTSVLSIRRADKNIVYVVQPLLDADSLGHKVLAGADPDPDHPFLIALCQTIPLVSDRLSFDAQVTNFSWDGARLTLVDVGTPFRWAERGELLFDLDPFTPMIPAPLRGLIKRDLLKVIDRWKEPRNVAVDIVANLHREGLEPWMAPTITALNRELDGPPVTMAEAMAVYRQDFKTFPRLTRLQRLERRWQTSIRRKPYDFFISDTYRVGGR